MSTRDPVSLTESILTTGKEPSERRVPCFYSRFYTAGPQILTEAMWYKMFDTTTWWERGFKETGYKSKDCSRPNSEVWQNLSRLDI